MIRLSVVFAAADDIKRKPTDLISNIYAIVEIDSIKTFINSNTTKALYDDHKDIGAGGKLLEKRNYIKSIMKSTSCNKRLI